MKKIILLSAIALLCASMVFAFTSKDFPGLKGTWEGTGTNAAGLAVHVTLEIMNDMQPLQAKLTFTQLPEKAKSDYGIPDPAVGVSNNGQITSDRTILFTGENGFFELQYIDKDKRLKGWGYFKGFKANVILKKK